MGGGGKARKVETTQKTELPPGLEQGANEVLAAGLRSASLPYSPNRGVTVAAFTPQQQAAMQGANLQAAAFGLPTGGFGMPQPETNAYGIQGYSTGDMYDEMLAQSTTPEQQDERQGLLASYRNSAGRIYDAAKIDPFDPGATLPGSDAAVNPPLVSPNAPTPKPNKKKPPVVFGSRDYWRQKSDADRSDQGKST